MGFSEPHGDQLSVDHGRINVSTVMMSLRDVDSTVCTSS